MSKLTYVELKNKQPELEDCFFAFSKSQYAEGVKEHNLEGKKLYATDCGLYGTKEGIKKFMSFYDANYDQIRATCDPQEVYDDEFINHECSYVGDDYKAIKITAGYFDEEKVRKVKRRCARVAIEDLDFSRD